MRDPVGVLLSTLVGALAAIAAGLTVYVVIVFIKESGKEAFELKKDDWVCAQFENRSYTYMTWVGKIATPHAGTRQECVEWRRK